MRLADADGQTRLARAIGLVNLLHCPKVLVCTHPVKAALRCGLAAVQRTVFAPVLVTGDGEG